MNEKKHKTISGFVCCGDKELRLCISDTSELLAIEFYNVPLTEDAAKILEELYKVRLQRVINIHWSLYEKALEKLLKDIKKTILKKIEDNTFTYKEFNGKLAIDISD